MALHDLPLEILREILVQAVLVRGVKHGLRLRLVNRLFSIEVLPAVFDSGLSEEEIIRRYEQFRADPHYLSLCQHHAAHKILSKPKPPTPRLQAILEVAERLCIKAGTSRDTNLKTYIRSMCYTPLVLRTNQFVVQERYMDRYLLQAAILNDLESVVKEILAAPIRQSIVDAHHVGDICDVAPLELAGRQGNISILRILLTNRKLPRVRPREELREEALQGAVFSGHLHAIEYIFSTELGPVDFLSSAYCIEGPLEDGVMNSPHVDFTARLYKTVNSLHSKSFPIHIGEEPNVNDQLHRICRARIQRVDIARHLLDRGAIVQADDPYVGNRSRPPGQIEPLTPWNPLRAATKSGHEKLVRLLLERGADPTKVDDDILWHAARLGRGDITKMLIEKGADVNRIPRKITGPQVPKWESPLVNAFLADNRDLWRYLLFEKGAKVEDEKLKTGNVEEWEEWVRTKYAELTAKK